MTFARGTKGTSVIPNLYRLHILTCGRSGTYKQPPERGVTTDQAVIDIVLALDLIDQIALTGCNDGVQPIASLRDTFATLGDRMREEASKRNAKIQHAVGVNTRVKALYPEAFT